MYVRTWMREVFLLIYYNINTWACLLEKKQREGSSLFLSLWLGEAQAAKGVQVLLAVLAFSLAVFIDSFPLLLRRVTVQLSGSPLRGSESSSKKILESHLLLSVLSWLQRKMKVIIAIIRMSCFTWCLLSAPLDPNKTHLMRPGGD